MISLPTLPLARKGYIASTSGCVATVASLESRVGDVCNFELPDGRTRRGEVIALRGRTVLVWVEDGVAELSPATPVTLSPDSALLPVGPALLGRVIDPYGRPIDGRPRPACAQRLPIQRPCPTPMTRRRIDQRFVTGVRAIDGLCTLGIGQRVGVMAPAGVGKTTLLGMLARYCESDVNVIALVGERGREVREFIEDSLGESGLARSVVVCATSDRSPLERQRAAFAATTVAEYFRDRGQHVLLMVDSLTRFARAQRELGLAQGEMPTRRGYPSSLFATLPALVERAGPGSDGPGGDITALYTVLMEDAESADPVAEEVKSLLDGHLLLSRSIATSGIFPAIDIRASISRLMDGLVDPRERDLARQARSVLEKHAEILPLIQMGEYRAGEDARADQAVRCIEPLRAWLGQSRTEKSELTDTEIGLAEVFS